MIGGGKPPGATCATAPAAQSHKVVKRPCARGGGRIRETASVNAENKTRRIKWKRWFIHTKKKQKGLPNESDVARCSEAGGPVGETTQARERELVLTEEMVGHQEVAAQDLAHTHSTVAHKFLQQ